MFIHYVELPVGMEKLYLKGTIGMYLYYLLWQWYAYKKASKLKKAISFKLAHHVTWGSIQMGSFLYKLGIPFIFGPSGGGQTAPVAFRKYFLSYWAAEEKREMVARLMLKYNPAFKAMIKKAAVVLVSNKDTLELARGEGAGNVVLTLDAALPEHFFPESFAPKETRKEELKLLWVGRFMPRKGILLLLDVMKELKAYPGISLTVVGDGEMREAFLEKIAEYELGKTVIWTGKVPYTEVREHYQKNDVFFFTSLRDSCPAQLIEAMAFGLPVVTIDLHGQSAIVKEDTGIRCNCTTPEIAIKELTQAILLLYNNPQLVNQMSTAAYQFAKQQTWTAKIDTVVNQFYSSL